MTDCAHVAARQRVQCVCVAHEWGPLPFEVCASARFHTVERRRSWRQRICVRSSQLPLQDNNKLAHSRPALAQSQQTWSRFTVKISGAGGGAKALRVSRAREREMATTRFQGHLKSSTPSLTSGTRTRKIDSSIVWLSQIISCSRIFTLYLFSLLVMRARAECAPSRIRSGC